MFFWGLCFAYQVGLLITAHTTKQPLPYYNLLMLLSIVGAYDARQGSLGKFAFQSNPDYQMYAVYIALAIAAGFYAFFVYDVVGEVRSMLCFEIARS